MLKPQVKGIVKFGLAFQGFTVFLGLPLFIFLAYQTMHDVPLLSLLTLAGAVFFVLIGKKYLENVYYKEYLILNPDSITVVVKKLFQKKEIPFKIQEVQSFGLAVETNYTQHPMANEVIDFTGLQTTEKELQLLIDEGAMEISTSNKTLRFGKNLPSWEVEDIVAAVEKYYGLQFKKNENDSESAESDDGNME
jgi:hypothetical protein